METKTIASLVLIIVAAVLISTSECIPLSDDPAGLLAPVPDELRQAEMAHFRQARQFGYGGFPYGGYGGGLGGYGGGSSASAAATASATSAGGGIGGYPGIFG